MIGSTYHPVMHFLWDGVPFEDLGIADALMQASFTLTCARSSSSRTFKAGKPKVGSASIDFVTNTRDIERRLVDLVRVKQFPVISVAAGYDDGQIFWLGAFRMHDIRTSYGKGISVSLNGESNKVVQMKEDMRPKSYENRTTRQILEEIAKEHKYTLKIDPTLDGLDVPLKNLTKTNRESLWQFVTRSASNAGAAGLFFVVRHPHQFKPNGGNGVSTLSGKEPAISYELHITRTPGFVNLQAEPATYIPRIGNGTRRDNSEFDTIDIFAKEIDFKEEGKYGAPSHTAASVGGEDDLPVATAGWGNGRNPNDVDPMLAPDIFTLFGFPGGGGAGLATTGGKPAGQVRAGYRGELPGTPVYIETVDMLPPEVDDGGLTSRKLMAAAVQSRFTITADVDLVPAQPWIQPPSYIEIVNTVAYNGLWGVETSQITFNKASGLTQTLTCRPAKLESNQQQQSKKGKGDPLRVATPGIPELGVLPTYMEYTDVDSLVFREAVVQKTGTEQSVEQAKARAAQESVRATPVGTDFDEIEYSRKDGYKDGYAVGVRGR